MYSYLNYACKFSYIQFSDISLIYIYTIIAYNNTNMI